jgi:hypothetical protein
MGPDDDDNEQTIRTETVLKLEHGYEDKAAKRSQEQPPKPHDTKDGRREDRD